MYSNMQFAWGLPADGDVTTKSNAESVKHKKRVAFVESASDSDDITSPRSERTRNSTSASLSPRLDSQNSFAKPLGGTMGLDDISSVGSFSEDETDHQLAAQLSLLAPPQSQRRADVSPAPTLRTHEQSRSGHPTMRDTNLHHAAAKSVESLRSRTSSARYGTGLDDLPNTSWIQLEATLQQIALPTTNRYAARDQIPSRLPVSQRFFSVAKESGCFKYVKGIVPSTTFQTQLIDHEPHSRRELDDDFYKEGIEALYKQVSSFVETYCCPSYPAGFDVSQKGNSPWDIKQTHEFVSHAEYVACSDGYSGGWNRLMIDRVQRKFLLVGILVRILHLEVFNDLLFGASKSQKDMLMQVEKTLVLKDGFERTSLRQASTYTILGHSPVTDSLDNTVANLTAQTLTMIKPLTTYILKVNFEQIPGVHAMQEVATSYLNSKAQALSDIFSQAGYMSLSMRHSETIFTFNAVHPGDIWKRDLHCSNDDAYYTSSKESVLRGLKVQGLSTNLKNHDFSALIKIAVWPTIERYKPGDGISAREISGFRIMELCKAKTIVYWGTKSSKAPVQPRLTAWLAQRQYSFLRTWSCYLILVVLLVAMTVRLYTLHLSQNDHREMAEDLGNWFSSQAKKGERWIWMKAYDNRYWDNIRGREAGVWLQRLVRNQISTKEDGSGA